MVPRIRMTLYLFQLYSDFGWASRVVKLANIHSEYNYPAYFFTFNHQAGISDISQLRPDNPDASYQRGTNSMNLIYFFGIPVFDDGSKAIKHDGDLRKAFNKFLFLFRSKVDGQKI